MTNDMCMPSKLTCGWKARIFVSSARCFPSQDTSKSPYKCVLCVDRREGRCYGARCRCVSGLGETFSHVAAVLFARENFSSRGMHLLSGPSVTDIICKWNKPCSQKVNPLPLSRLDIKKASSAHGGRKKEGMDKIWHHKILSESWRRPPNRF